MTTASCRAVECQQFEIALLLLEAGADPVYTCKTADGWQSPSPLTMVMLVIPAGKADVNVRSSLIWPRSSAADAVAATAAAAASAHNNACT